MTLAAPHLRPADPPRPAPDARKFASLGRPRRVWAVAAVHGEAARLRALHDALAERFRVGDRLVYLGGMIGRGPAVGETIDELLYFRRAVLALPGMVANDVVFLRGAQEEMWHKLLQLQFAPDPGAVLRWMLDQGVCATLAAYGGDATRGFQAAREGAVALSRWTNGLRAAMRARPGHDAFAASWRRAALTADRGLLLVHAGVAPGRPLDDQADAFWWNAAGFARLSGPFDGFARVVRGFDPRRAGPTESAHALSLDAGCGFGGPLRAACLSPQGAVLETLEA